MKCLEAWNVETGNTGVEVAHICLGSSASTGAHPDIAHLDLDLNYAGSYGGNNGSVTTHATACVALMSAENNNTRGQCGVAGGWGATPGCKYTYYGMPNSVAGQIAAYTWVGDRGCIAANVSFGGGYPGAGVEDAINYAWDNDCIITAAAGNNYYPEISYPAYFGNAMAIGGTQHGTSGYGNENVFTYGLWVELLAPGGQYSIGYNGMAWGTSFSAPKVAGLIGLMKSEHSGWTVEQLRSYVTETGDWIDYIPGNDEGRTGLLGGGAANAYEALKVYNKNVSLNRLWVPCVKWYLDSTIVYQGKYLDPQVVVQNRGINRESFMVTLEIDTAGGGNIYTGTRFVEGLADRTDKTNKGEIVTFDTWFTGDVSTDTAIYEFTAYTSLAGDENTVNDTVSETVYVLPSAGGGVTDTLMYDTDAPAWYFSDQNLHWAVRMEPQSPCSVMAIRFYAYSFAAGNYQIYTWSDNGSGLPQEPADYGPQTYMWSRNGMQTVPLTTKQYYTGTFHLGFSCPGDPNGPYVIADNGPGTGHSSLKPVGQPWEAWGTYNWVIRAIVFYPGLHDDDIACWSVITPDKHEFYDVPLLPSATFKNIGSISQSNFPVTMRISIKNGAQVYTSTKTITTTLNTYDTTTVAFDGWTPGTNDTVFNMACFSALTGDDAPGNDTIAYEVAVNQIDTIVYDDNNSRWYYGSATTTDLWAVTFTPTKPCSVIGMEYELLCRPSPSTTACTLIAWTAVNDTPAVRQWGQEDPTPQYGWQSYTFTNPQKFNRPNAEPFALGYWVPGETMTDSVYPLADDQPTVWHSYFKAVGYPSWTVLSHNLMVRAFVKYTAGAYAHDVAAYSFDNPIGYDWVYPDREVVPQATILNYGKNSETFDVIFTIDDSLGVTEYADTQNVMVGIASSEQVSFAPWAPQVIDMDYDMYVKTTLGTDQNTANDQITSMVFCRTINIISYNEETWGSIGDYGDEYPYQAVRFTPERPCTVWGAMINMWSNVNNNTNPCSLFLWADTLDHPAMTTIDYDTFTMHGVGADTGGYVYRFRIDFSPQTYETDEDFWIGVYADPVTNAGADTALIAFSDFGNYSNIDGRSLTDTIGRPNDRWYAITWVSATDTTQADWEIKALVKYLEYPGDAPLAPVIRVAKSGNNARVWWNSVTTDISGNPTECDHYTLYEDAAYNFTPGDAYFLAGTADTFYNHTNALISSVHNYLVYSFNKYGTKSPVCSNMGFVLSKFFNENPAKTDRNWVSLPYRSNYATVSQLVADLSPAGNPLTSITNLRDDQLYETYLYNAIFHMWLGTNFAITPGRAYEMVTTTDTFLVIVGSNDPNGLVTLNENPTKTDRNWVSIPYNAVYNTVSNITSEYAPTGNPLTSITNLRDDQLYETYLYNAIFHMWLGTNFAITPGRAYEFVTTVDTTWDPTEYSNEAAKAMLARQGAVPADVEVVLGTAVETDRAPAFAVEHAGVGLSTVPVVQSQSVGKDMSSVSHTVLVPVELGECSGLVFTAYRPDAPSDVLTEEMVGSGVAYKDGLGTVWFNAGNFAMPWQPGDEVVLIIEATKDGKGYFAVMRVELDETVDVQNLATVSLAAIPEPTIENGVAYWKELDNDQIIGYSLYDNDTRINSEMITAAGYAVVGEVSLKLVFTGGYETVSGSQGFEDARPTAFAFSIRPNPFAERATVSYALPKAQNVSIEVYDVTGRQVATLASGAHEPGFYQVTWAGDDALGRQAATGVYFVKILTDEYQSQHKVIFVR
jgi:hypothetical protein